MPRIFLACRDLVFCDALRLRLTAEQDFQIIGQVENGPAAVEEALRLGPDLIILELDDTAGNDLALASSMKEKMPAVPLFVVLNDNSMLLEKEAILRGADAVFKKEKDFTALMMNARAIFDLN